MIGPWFVDRFLTAASVTSCQYVVLVADLDTTQQRVAARRFADPAATRHMHAQFADATDARFVVDATPPAERLGETVIAGLAQGRYRYRP
ncbi:MAG: hypothetical protein ACK5OX_04715 [Desertimonas sp.]